MDNLITIRITDKKARKVIESLEEIKFIQIVNDPTLGLTGKKKKQAKLAELGKIKLKTADNLINELKQLS